MKTIWRYEILGRDLDDTVTISMPRGAVPFAAALKNGEPNIWVAVDDQRPLEPQEIYIRGTGHPLTGEEEHYFGTIILDMHG